MSKFKVGDKVINNGKQDYGYSKPGQIRYVVWVQYSDRILLAETAGGEPVADGYEYPDKHFDLVVSEQPVAGKEEYVFRTTSHRTLIDIPFPLTDQQKALVLSMLTMMEAAK